MMFTKVALALTTLATGALAASSEFYLKTSSSSPAHNGLYVESYHTGAGISDAVLTSNSSNAGKFLLNTTSSTLLMDINDPAEPNIYYAWYVEADTNYAGWQFVTINIGDGRGGFSLASNGTLLFDYDGFSGWLVCDWWHGVPQLFYFVEFYRDPYPSSCSLVTLVSQSIRDQVDG